MLPFEYKNPVEVVFENGAVHKLSSLLLGRWRKVLLVAAGQLPEQTLQEVRAQICDSGAELVTMDAVDSNPKLRSVYQGVEAARSAGADCVLALGGGSAMDCAKLIAVSAKTGVDPYEYVWGSRPKAEDSLDTIMVPTIAATGTELNDTAVIVNEKTREKYWCVCKHPKLCVMDPALSATLPMNLTIWGAMDVLSHTFEFYLNGNMQSEFQLCFSEALLTTIMRALERLVEDPTDLTARGEMLWCSTITWGTGLTKIGRGQPDMTCHSIEESFSGFFDTHHGACLGVLTPRWMQMVAPGQPKLFARFARRVMGIQDADDARATQFGVKAYIDWLKRVKAPQTYFDLSDKWAFDDTQLKTVADNAWRIYHGNIGRLQSMSREEILTILLAGRKVL